MVNGEAMGCRFQHEDCTDRHRRDFKIVVDGGPIPQWPIWFADSSSQNALIPAKIRESLIPKLCQRNDIIVEFNKLCQHIENYGDSDDRPPNIYRETATLEG